MTAITSPWSGRRATLVRVTPAMALPLVGLALGWRGGDLAAQVFRADMFHRVGFSVWDNLWFAGHPTLDYSLVMPALAAHIAPRFLGAIAGIISAVVFGSIATRAWPHTAGLATIWFAAGTATNFAVGRVAFALGLVFALVAVAAMQQDRPAIAAAAGAATACTSPVAGLFVALGSAAWGLTHRTRRVAAAVVVACTLFPTLVVAAIFGSTGTFPYGTSALARDLAVCALVYYAAGQHQRVVRTATVLYATTCIAAYVIATPLGANVSRLGQYAAGPILVALLLPRRVALLRVVALPLLLWQWLPAIDGIVHGGADATAHAAYYRPVLAFFDQHVPTGRIEVPSLLHHWESVFVAEQHPLARGWERQLDRGYSDIFYNDTLSAGAYHSWLLDNAVEYVALADAKLDVNSQAERSLLLTHLDYLQPMLTTDHWRVWKVSDYRGYADGPGRLVSMGTDTFTVKFDHPGSILVRIHYMSRWATEAGACVARTTDGWTRVNATSSGQFMVHPAWFPQRCPAPIPPP